MSMKKSFKNKWVLAVSGLIVLVAIPLLWKEYKFAECVRIENENLVECNSKNLEKYDCTIFEKAEEHCAMAVYR